MEDGKVMNKLNVLYEDNHIIVVEKPNYQRGFWNL